MCGIAGIVDFNQTILNPESKPVLLAMARTLAHRGPDDEGVYLAPDCMAGLAHRRLSVIDLNTGHQPLCNEEGSIWIVYNGECYNFMQLRRRLCDQGHIFKTQSDTEVIIHLYEEEGPDCVKFLRGMFAFAIWNEKDQTLFLARDRFGQKPLYFSIMDGCIRFGSECKAILQDATFPRQANMNAIAEYLLLGYIRAPETAFLDIHQLPPAHHLTLTRNTCHIARPVCYWTIPGPDSHNSRQVISMQKAAEQVQATLTEAVQLRMISDVPLGAFLSGGIDSSCIAALMTRISNQPIEACSIGFNEGLYNELLWARQSADYIGANLHEETVRPDIADTVEKLARHYDEPFADSSALPTWYLSQMTRRHVTVALTGDGGDELFGGYNRYKAIAHARLLQSNVLIHWIANLKLWRTLKTPEHHSFIRHLKRFFTALNLPPDKQYLQWISVFDPALVRNLLADTPPLSELNPTAEFMDCPHPHAYLNQALYFDATSYLPSDLNTKIDRASMAFGLELRSPFQDHLLVELVNRLPLEYRHDGSSGKRILKLICQNLIPAPIIKRPKMGFGVPVGAWFRTSLKSLFHDMVLSNHARCHRILNRSRIQSLFTEHNAGREDHGHRLWALLMLELWMRQYLS